MIPSMPNFPWFPPNPYFPSYHWYGCLWGSHFSVEYGEIDRKNNLEHSSHGIAEPPPHFEVRLKSCLFDIRLPSNWQKHREENACFSLRSWRIHKKLPSVVLDVFKVMCFFPLYHGKSPFFTTIFGEYVLLFSSIELKQQIQVVLDGRELFSTPSAPGGICHGLCQIAPGASTKTPKGWFPPTKASRQTPKSWETVEQLPRLTLRLVFGWIFMNFQMTKITWNRHFHPGIQTEAVGSSTKCQCQWVSQMLHVGNI